MVITVTDYQMNQIRILENVECDDAEDWLYENDPDYGEGSCQYMTNEYAPRIIRRDMKTQPIELTLNQMHALQDLLEVSEDLRVGSDFKNEFDKIYNKLKKGIESATRT